MLTILLVAEIERRLAAAEVFRKSFCESLHLFGFKYEAFGIKVDIFIARHRMF